MFRLEVETADDWWEVETLFDLRFAPTRGALSSYRLRDGVPPVADLCRVARDSDGTLAGAVRYWPVRVGKTAEALLLGPIAVHPTRQGEGLGAFLIRDTLGRAKERGATRVILIGDAPYYSRFGFGALSDVTFPPPTNPDRVLGLSLVPDAWNGVSGMVGPFE